MHSFLDLAFWFSAAAFVYFAGVATGFVIQVLLKMDPHDIHSVMEFEQWREYLDPRGARHPPVTFYQTARFEGQRVLRLLQRVGKNGRH
jgi:hypothetical protein